MVIPQSYILIFRLVMLVVTFPVANQQSNVLISGNLPSSPQQFVVCERRKFSQLAKLPSSCFKVVKSEEELHGYKVAVVQEWALSKARYIYYWQCDREGADVCIKYFFTCNFPPDRLQDSKM